MTIWQPPTSPACSQYLLLSSTLDNCWLSFCRALNVTGNSRWNAGNALRVPDLLHQLKLPAGTAPPSTSLLSLLSNELPHQSLTCSPFKSLWLGWTVCVRGCGRGKESRGEAEHQVEVLVGVIIVTCMSIMSPMPNLLFLAMHSSSSQDLAAGGDGARCGSAAGNTQVMGMLC